MYHDDECMFVSGFIHRLFLVTFFSVSRKIGEKLFIFFLFVTMNSVIGK
jgi:hypothetical protein